MVGRLAWSSLVASIVLAGVARAEDAKNPQRISVDVRGHATRPADAIEVDVTVVATSESAKDAEKKYRERLQEVIAALKGEGGDKAPRRKKPEKATAKAKKAKPKADDDADEEEPAQKETPKVAKKPAKKPKADDADEDEDDKPAKKPPTDGGDKTEKPKGEKTETPKDGDKDDAAKTEGAGDADPAGTIPIELREEGLSISPKTAGDDPESMQQMVFRRMNGQQTETKEPSFRVASRVIVKIKEIGKHDRTALRKRVAWLIDKAMAAGATEDGGPPPRVRFIVEDGESLKRTAYGDAMTKAKARAEELAKLGGRSLGRVAFVRENAASGAAETATGQAAFQAAWFGANAPLAPPPTIDVASEVDLAVEFELAP